MAIALVNIGAACCARAAVPDRCALEDGATVCRIDGQVLRVIEETHSPSGLYAVAWLVPAAKKFLVKDPDDGTLRVDDIEIANMLLRLDDATIAARQAGTHPGDKARYNHLQIDVHWSAGSTFVGVLNQDKWETLSGIVFRIATDGNVSGPLDLLALSREAGLRHLGRQQPQIDTGEFATRLTFDTVADNGVIHARLTLEEPGGGGAAYTCSIALQVEGMSGKLHAKAIRLGQLQRVE